MTPRYTRERIENWVGDFCASDALRPFPAALRELAPDLLTQFLSAACEQRALEPAELEQADLRASLLGPLTRLALPEGTVGQVPALCGALLAQLEGEGRLAGGRALGAYVRALKSAYEAAAGPAKPYTRPGSPLGRNDPCPCGSGKKYKKCCQHLLDAGDGRKSAG